MWAVHTISPCLALPCGVVPHHSNRISTHEFEVFDYLSFEHRILGPWVFWKHWTRLEWEWEREQKENRLPKKHIVDFWFLGNDCHDFSYFKNLVVDETQSRNRKEKQNAGTSTPYSTLTQCVLSVEALDECRTKTEIEWWWQHTSSILMFWEEKSERWVFSRLSWSGKAPRVLIADTHLRHIKAKWQN